jgi:thiol-disulfide isomerase/thioredoxin
MKIRAKEKKLQFSLPVRWGNRSGFAGIRPVATPHIFIFDKERKLRYSGRIDDVEKPTKTPNTLDARNAIEALLNGKEVSVTTTKVFGCSVKWKEKEDLVGKSLANWSKEQVSVDTIGVAGIRNLINNNSDKLRLINVWATWCGPCVAEFPEFITISRMYRRRDFELVTISADDPDNKDKVLKFLKGEQAANPNYLFNIDDKYKLIEAIDPKWEGALPYTLIVEPGGTIVYAKQGQINPAEVKRLIVDNKYIGRYY